MKINKLLSTSFNLFKLGRTFYVLPLVAIAIAGFLSAESNFHNILTIISIFFSMIFVGMAAWAENEISDYSADMNGITKKKWKLYVSGGTQLIDGVQLSIKQARIYIICLNILAISIALHVGFYYFLMVLLIMFIGLAYSINPLRLKTKGLWGLGSVAFAYGVVSYSAGWIASGDNLSIYTIIVGAILSIAFFGFEGLSYLIDYDQDFNNKEKTFVVSIGYKKAKYLLATFQMLPVTFLLVTNLHEINSVFLLILFVISLIFALFTIYSKGRDKNLMTLRILGVPVVSLMGFMFI